MDLVAKLWVKLADNVWRWVFDYQELTSAHRHDDVSAMEAAQTERRAGVSGEPTLAALPAVASAVFLSLEMQCLKNCHW